MLRFISRPREFAAGSFFVIVSAVAAYALVGLEVGTARRMGPGYFPLAVSLLLMTSGIVLIARSMFQPRGTAMAVSLLPMAAIAAACIVFALLLRPAGLVPAIFAATLVASIADRDRRLGRTVATGAVLAVGASVIFVWALGVPLPVFGRWLAN